MKKLTITQKEKRFLIIWIGICLFAFFVNLVPIEGKIDDFTYIFTVGESGGFYPFTSDFMGRHFIGYDQYDFMQFKPRFNGIFNSFNLPEFIFYILLGFGIVYIPKIW